MPLSVQFLSVSVLFIACPSFVLSGLVILSGGSHCSTGAHGSNAVQHAVPGDTININCSVDNPDGGFNALHWSIPRLGVDLTNLNGADDSEGGFESIVTSFDNTADITNATLTFTAVSALDTAEISCRDVTSEVNSCTLFILTIPSVPLNINCTDVTNNSITITWDPPDDNGGNPVLLYKITETPGNTARNIASTNVTETDLTPRTDYTFFVRASNSEGFSNSTNISCSTIGELRVFSQLPVDDIEVCLGYNGTRDFLSVSITSQDCPPSSPNNVTTPPFDNFTHTIAGVGSVITATCQSMQFISEERDYTISVTVNNMAGSSDVTTKNFDSHWIRNIKLENSTLSYSVVDCTLVEDANVTLTVTGSDSAGFHATLIHKEQPYDPGSTTFDISSLSPSASYNYTLLVIAPGIVIASYDGSISATITSPSSSLQLPSSISSINSSSVHMSALSSMPLTTSQYCLCTSVSIISDNEMSSSVFVAAGTSVAIAVLLTAVITAIITIVIMYLCNAGSLIRHYDNKQMSDGTPITTPQGYEPEIMVNAAYGRINHSDDEPVHPSLQSDNVAYGQVNHSDEPAHPLRIIHDNAAYGQVTDKPSQNILYDTPTLMK